MTASRRQPGRALRAALVALLAAGGAAAQMGSGEPTLSDLALLWAMGEYRGPVICQVDGGPRRLARSLRIRPPESRGYRSLFILELRPLEVGGAHCVNDLGVEEPDVAGSARITLTHRARPDTARKDFELELRHEGGFRYEIPSGEITVTGAGGERRVDLAGGAADLRRVDPASDAARMLGDVEGLPKRTLVLEARDGTRLEFNLVYIAPR